MWKYLCLLLFVAAVTAKKPEGKKPTPISELKGDAEQRLGKSGDAKEGDMKIGKGEGGSDRNMITGENYRWPKSNGIVTVPYVIESGLVYGAESQFLAAAKDYARFTCIKFVRRTTQKDYLTVFSEDGCWSYVGKQGGAQQLSLGNGCQHDKGTATHEMMHALGFQHEQSRWDRDQHITVNLANVEPDNAYNFDRCNQNDCTLPNYKYDYLSVMHYESTAFSMNRKPTMVPKTSGAVLGQRKGLSALDIKKLAQMYKCGTTTVESSRGFTVPAEEKVDSSSNCPGYKLYCADPSDNYYYLSTCEKTCAGVQKGDPYDIYNNCNDFLSYCADDAETQKECGATCKAAGK